MTIRVRRRPNAATINLDHLYDLNLGCLYGIFKFVAPTRKRVLDAELVLCFKDPISLGFISEAPHPQAKPVPVAVDSMMSIQELSHHLALQEMDYELYDTTGSGLRLIATGYVKQTLHCRLDPAQ